MNVFFCHQKVNPKNQKSKMDPKYREAYNALLDLQSVTSPYLGHGFAINSTIGERSLPAFAPVNRDDVKGLVSCYGIRLSDYFGEDSPQRQEIKRITEVCNEYNATLNEPPFESVPEYWGSDVLHRMGARNDPEVREAALRMWDACEGRNYKEYTTARVQLDEVIIAKFFHSFGLTSSPLVKSSNKT